jgi:hypothetical protein
MVTALIMTFTWSTPAKASAWGFEPWEAYQIGDVSIPAGILEHEINGSGLQVAWEWAEFEVLTNNVCNWRIDFRYHDANGAVYKRLLGTMQPGCDRVGSRTVYPGKLRTGRACARLHTSGDFIIEQCHHIFP